MYSSKTILSNIPKSVMYGHMTYMTTFNVSVMYGHRSCTDIGHVRTFLNCIDLVRVSHMCVTHIIVPYMPVLIAHQIC